MARKKKNKSASRKKKRSRKDKKSGKKAEPAPKAASAAAEVEAPTSEPEPAAAAPPTDVDAPAVDDDVTIIDLDAHDADEVTVIDLDAEEVDEDAVAQLIAATVATADPEVHSPEPEAPVIDLDAEPAPVAEALAADAGQAGAGEGKAVAAVETPRDEAEAVVAAKDSQAAAADVVTNAESAADEAFRRLAELGPVSSPEVRSRLLAEALAHAEHKDARYRVPFSQERVVARWKALAASVVLLLAAFLAVAPPTWIRPEPPAQLTADERERNLRSALLLQAQQIEAFRVRENRLPDTLDEVTERLPGLAYVRSGTRAYQLVAYQADGSAVIFDSSNPLPAFDSLGVTRAAAAEAAP